MFLQTIFLWFTVTVFSAVTAACVLFWLSGQLVGVGSYASVPVIPTRPVLTYWEWIERIYKQKSVRGFILRLMECICVLYGEQKVFMLWLGPRPIIVFHKPEAVELLLNNTKTISKSIEYRFLQPWLGTGLLTSNGVKWRSHRKLLTPTFHFQILENFMTTFNEEAQVLTSKLEAEAVGKAWIDIVPRIIMFTLDTICQTAMGVHLNVQSGGGKDYVRRIDEISELFFYRLLRPWLWSDVIFNYCSPAGWKFCRNVQAIHDFTNKVIKEKKELMLKEVENKDERKGEEPKKKKKAFLELLLELHLKDSSFTEENIREEVDTFMFKGHDTTAMAISWTLYELGQHQDIQDKVYQELDSIFGGDKNREVTSEDLRNMKYLECTMKETLRLYPSVSFIARKLTESLKIDDKYTLPAGCTCFVCIFMLHKDPVQFPRSEIFDPDRFLPENCCKRHPYAYVPFSAGPRNCIGQRFALMEEKTVLAHILRKFKVISLDYRDRVTLQAGLILKNADPIRIRFELRETAAEG